MAISDSSSRILAGLLEARTGQQLTMSRRWRIETALSALLRERGIASLDELITILVMGKEPGLSNQVVEALLNNETYFFRDRQMFDQLIDTVLPEIAARRTDSRKINILCAGCSTGQEALSLSMQIDKDPRWRGWPIEILGVDISHSAIASARAGTYSQFEVQRGLGVAQMLEYFTETPRGWEVSEQLRSRIRYRVHNLLEPMTGSPQFDLVLCRNVLLYFGNETRAQAFTRLIEQMDPQGWIMLGAGETVVGHTTQLSSVPDMIGLYRLSANKAASGGWRDIATAPLSAVK